MADARVEPQSASPAQAGALKIVLFGMPDAGKTSLLGALAQSVESQDKVLGGTLVDLSGGLAELRHEVYETKVERTVDPVVPYPVHYEPEQSPAPGGAAGKPVDLVLFDCDGRIANEYLNNRKSLQTSGDEELARAVLGADALLLVVDASAPSEVLKRDFTHFLTFLRLLEQTRSSRNDVNGLPVYLVLTKCDLLAEEGDSASVWMDRIEERKRKVDQFFRSQMEKEAELHAHQFGRIELRVWATAVKRPPLGKTAAKPRDPYQVAELFRQGIDSAVDFRRQRRKAQRRLGITFGIVAGVAGFLLLLALAFLVLRDRPEVAALEKKIDSYMKLYDRTSAERFLRLDESMPNLEKFQKDPFFESVNADLKKFVNDELRELNEYRSFAQSINEQSNRLAVAASEETMKDVEARLKSLAPPAEYAGKWRDAPAQAKRKERLEDIAAIRLALPEVKAKLDDVVSKTQQAKKDKQFDFEEHVPKKIKENADKYLAYLSQIPDEKLPMTPFSERVRWAEVYQFDGVRQLHDQWKSLREYLEEQKKKAQGK